MRHQYHHKKILRSFTSVILFLFSVITLSSCGSQPQPEGLGPAVLIVDGVPTEPSYIMTIDGHQISLDEYRFYYFFAKDQMDQGDDSYWNQSDSDRKQQELKNLTMQTLESSYAIREMADQLQLSLTDTERDQIDSDVKNQIATLGGNDNYQKALSKKYLNDRLYRQIWEINFCRQKLWSYYFDEGGPLYISDDAVSNDEKQTSYSSLFAQMLATARDDLTIQLTPEYELISIDTLQ